MDYGILAFLAAEQSLPDQMPGTPPAGRCAAQRPRHAKRTGALLVSADTSTGACARSCKRGSSLHSDPSRWETGQVKLLRRPMDRHSITKSTFILFQLPVQRKRRRNASTQAIFLQLAAATMLPAPSGETRGGMRSSTGSPHQMHIASSAKKKELAVEAPYHDISCQAGRPPPCVNGGRCGVL